MSERKQRTPQQLLEDIKKYLEVYPRANRDKWEAKRIPAIRAISKELDRYYDDLKLFDEFWNAYPLKKNKPDSIRAWQQTINARPPLSVLISAILNQSKTKSWMEGYVPMPASWLRGHRWADELELKLPDVHNEKPWHETASGIEAKGKELGITPDQFETFPHFKTAVMRAAMKAA
jgi:hypothetical protein